MNSQPDAVVNRSAAPAMLERPAVGYRHLLEDLALSNPDRRRDGVNRLLVQRAASSRHLSHRNRMWADAVSLLSDGQPWSIEHEQWLLDPQELRRLAQRVEGIENPPSQLATLTDEVLGGTWATFEDFWSSAAGGGKEFAEGMDNRLGEFQRWFRHHLPYLMIGLPAVQDAAESELARRIDLMLNKLFPGEQPSDGQRAVFAGEAWTYAQLRWQEAHANETQQEGRTAG